MMYDTHKSTSFVVRELLQKVERRGTAPVIGVPGENRKQERRVALTPETVALLVESGYRVLLQAGAGLSINYTDSYYAESGAEIVETAEELFQADLILKILPPTLEEVRMMRPRTTVYSFFHIHKITLP